MSKSESKKKGGSKKSGGNSFVTFIKSDTFRKICGVFLILFTLFLAVVFVSYLFSWQDDYVKPDKYSNWGGKIGYVLSNFFIFNTFGIAAFGFLAIFASIGLRTLNIKWLPLGKTLTICVFWMCWISLFFGFFYPTNPDNPNISRDLWISQLAGVVGFNVAQWLQSVIGKIGLALILLFSLGLGLHFIHNVSFKGIVEYFNKLSEKTRQKKTTTDDKKEPDTTGENSNQEKDDNDTEKQQFADTKQASNSIDLTSTEDDDDINYTPDSTTDTELEINMPTKQEATAITDDELDEFEPESDEEYGKKHFGIDEPFDPRAELKDYKFPTPDMLDHHEDKNQEVTRAELISNKDRIVETLKNYSIEIVKIVASPGPTVTLYEIIPAPGIRISKIKNLEDDIALSLSALGIRIIAPIPGKGTIGIEVPNAKPQVVSMLTMINSDQFQNNKYELPIAIGKTVSNEPFVTDLTKMPHLLMAGATGQGKSVGLNAIIASLLYKKHPAELKFIMVDPKKVELSLYNTIERHYLAKLPDSEEAIITDVKKVVRTLNSLCIEMDTRYDLLKQAQVRNIKEYNPKFISRQLNPEHGHHYMPYIVVIVDEFADLIMTAGREVEQPIARLAQLARAVGIHLIIATQRPTVNIITGTIKANFPARVAFRVTSKIDSRTILDTGGADQLIGRGDMLLSSGSEIVRLQCALIDTPEIQRIVDYIGSQRGYPDCFLLPEYLDEDAEPNKDFDPNKKDEFFEQAARLVVSSQHGSTSLLQRKLSLGYNRAGKIIDQLEAAGIVGPFEGSKAREVLIKTEAELNELLDRL